MKCPHCNKEIPKEQIAAAMGKSGGKSKSDAKRKAVAENGKKRIKSGDYVVYHDIIFKVKEIRKMNGRWEAWLIYTSGTDRGWIHVLELQKYNPGGVEK